jgi:hypothetical protein
MQSRIAGKGRTTVSDFYQKLHELLASAPVPVSASSESVAEQVADLKAAAALLVANETALVEEKIAAVEAAPVAEAPTPTVAEPAAPTTETPTSTATSAATITPASTVTPVAAPAVPIVQRILPRGQFQQPQQGCDQ